MATPNTTLPEIVHHLTTHLFALIHLLRAQLLTLIITVKMVLHRYQCPTTIYIIINHTYVLRIPLRYSHPALVSQTLLPAIRSLP